MGATTPNFAAAINYQDLWWVANGAQCGWGINFAHQGSVFATLYTYDVGGTPLWLSVLAWRGGATNTYTGTLYPTSGPRFDAYDPTKVTSTRVGTATLIFADGNHAKFGNTTNGDGALPVVTQSKQITLPVRRCKRDALSIAAPAMDNVDKGLLSVEGNANLNITSTRMTIWRSGATA